jgi:hypothetical protein
MSFEETYSLLLHNMDLNFKSLNHYFEQRSESVFFKFESYVDNEFKFSVGFDKYLITAKIRAVKQIIEFKTYNSDRNFQDYDKYILNHIADLDIITDIDGISNFVTPKTTRAMGREVDGTMLRTFGKDYMEQLLKIIA